MKNMTFSKLIVGAVMILYFLGAAFGMWIVARNPEYISELLAYIGAPTAVAIGFYSWKARAENTVKIRNTLVNQELKLAERLERLDPEAQERREQAHRIADEIMNRMEEE